MDNFEKLEGHRFVRLTKLSLSFDNVSNFDESFESNFSITRLTHLEISYYRTNKEQFFRRIIRSNKRLKYLKISAQKLTSEHLLTDLSNLKELQTLKFNLDISLKSKSILNKFKTIGRKCQKLKRFQHLNCMDDQHFAQTFLSLIEFYPNLVTLSLILRIPYGQSIDSSNISFQSLQYCSRLQNLIIICEMADTLLKNIAKYVPKVRFLWICIKRANEVIDCISKLPELQKVVIKSYNWFDEHQINPGQFHKLFTNCSRLKEVHLDSENESFIIYRSYLGAITQIGPTQSSRISDIPGFKIF